MEDKIKARLVIRLLADEVVVAESDDAALWQRTLGAITSGTLPREERGSREPAAGGGSDTKGDGGDGDPVTRLANELAVEVATLRGALGPTVESPYLHIDSRYWEALKRNTPSKGRGAMSPMRLAATALVLWFRAAGLGTATQAQAKSVMAAADLSDRHPERSLSSTEWLQTRGENVILNPAAISQAEEVVRAFCLKQAPSAKKARPE